jgi:hypothetical protein
MADFRLQYGRNPVRSVYHADAVGIVFGYSEDYLLVRLDPPMDLAAMPGRGWPAGSTNLLLIKPHSRHHTTPQAIRINGCPDVLTFAVRPGAELTDGEHRDLGADTCFVNYATLIQKSRLTSGCS